MAIIPAVSGIASIHPALPVASRPPATQASTADREHRSTEQEGQNADHSARLAQQAYQQQAHQHSLPKPALLAQDLMTRPLHGYRPTVPCWRHGRL